MSEKYDNKYRIASTRLPYWDYAKNGFYFLTICADEHEYHFGEVRNGYMFLNKIGELVKNFWLEIPHHFPFIGLDEFVIMPNHVHGILMIDREFIIDADNECELFPNFTVAPETGHCPVSTNGVVETTPKINRFRNQGKNTISSIIGSYKSVCSKMIHKNLNKNFAWQERFWDHLIKNEQSLFRIRNYIKNNPAKWDRDRNQKFNLWY